MSDGMSDANAVGRLAMRVDQAAYKLAEAIKVAQDGHRGLTVDEQEIANEHLARVGYELRRLPPR